MLKAWLIGAAILIVVFSIWFIFLQVEIYSRSAFIVLWVSPIVAAFVTSYMSPSHKILLGVSMAFPFAFLAVVLNTADQFFGSAVDFPGLPGGLFLFILILIRSVIISIPGSVAGYALTRNDR